MPMRYYEPCLEQRVCGVCGRPATVVSYRVRGDYSRWAFRYMCALHSALNGKTAIMAQSAAEQGIALMTLTPVAATLPSDFVGLPTLAPSATSATKMSPRSAALKRLRDRLSAGSIVHSVYRHTSRRGAETWDFFMLDEDNTSPYIVPIGLDMVLALQELGQRLKVPFNPAWNVYAFGAGMTIDAESSKSVENVDVMVVEALSGLLFGRIDALRCSRV